MTEEVRGEITFGSPLQGVRYRSRPAVYALLPREDGRIAVMRVGDEAFLPGGGIRPGETWEEAVRREVREEMGWTIRSPRILARTVEYLQADNRRESTRLEATFVQAEPERRALAPVELDHELEWMTPADAARLLTHRSHAWIAQAHSRLSASPEGMVSFPVHSATEGRRMFEVIVEEEPAIVLLRLKGPLDHGAEDLPLEVGRAAQRGKPIVIDLGGIRSVQSIGIGMLVEAFKSAQAAGRKIVFAGVRPLVATVLSHTKLDTILEIYPTVESARSALTPAGEP